MSGGPPILALPDVAMEKIFSYLLYDEIAKNRLVCKKFNEVGANLLTRGFLRIEKRHNMMYKKMKSQLPRRESERKVHPMARNCEILSAVETRLSMLDMTYTKYIDSDVCCFIPGKVIDEVDRILSVAETAAIPLSTHELLQEFRDISSMAIEHFDEAILPRLKPKAKNMIASSSKVPKLVLVQEMADELCKVLNQCKKMKQQLNPYVHFFNRMIPKFKGLNKKIKDKSEQISQQKQIIDQQAAKFREQENSIADLKKHIEEWNQKFADLTAELMRVREEFIPKSSSTNYLPLTQSSTTITPPVTPSFPKSFRPQLKPRMPLPKYTETLIERKRKSDLMQELDTACKIPRRPITLSEDISNKISRNITSNISKNITHQMIQLKEEKNQEKKSTNQGYTTGLINKLESLLKNRFNTGLSRKRKISEDITL